ncbi:MAG: serine hydrolase [Chthoniobacter sp.]
MKDGRVIYENYPNGHGANEAHKIYSGTKGFWIVAALKAVEEGIIDLDDRVANTLPEWNAESGKIAGYPAATAELFQRARRRQQSARRRLREPATPSRSTRRSSPSPARPSFTAGALAGLPRGLEAQAGGSPGKHPRKYLEHKVLRPLGLGPQRYLADKRGIRCSPRAS